MNMYYLLRGTEVVPCEMMEWALMFEESFNGQKKRVLRQEYYQRHGKRIFVSTVFLGLDHQYGEGPPLIFETMVFGGKLTVSEFGREIHEEIECHRWSNYEQAIAGHEMLMQRAKVEILGCKLKG